ncbi:hypothetical protein HQ545_04265 [Candidatus Woesearchaeota archaeon]|nr:hypothetical protein [Candidatus Woesearchaeota archaeon]
MRYAIIILIMLIAIVGCEEQEIIESRPVDAVDIPSEDAAEPEAPVTEDEPLEEEFEYLEEPINEIPSEEMIDEIEEPLEVEEQTVYEEPERIITRGGTGGSGSQETEPEEEEEEEETEEEEEAEEETEETVSSDVIQPSDLTYLGAFRVPDDMDDMGYEWGGTAIAYYPEHESLFMTGHEWYQRVGEFSIPEPKMGGVGNLNTANELQQRTDVREAWDYLEIPRAALAYVPGHVGLYMAFAQHLDFETTSNHGWTSITLDDSKGPYSIGGLWNYLTSDYMFVIPPAWADEHADGRSLATGRYRDGGQASQGPTIFAISPWDDHDYVTLLRYSDHASDPTAVNSLNDYSHADEWSGGAWIDGTVVFVGFKGKGNTWYGYYDGTVSEEPDYQEGPGERGWWADNWDAEIILYDVSDFESVVAGDMEAYEPQPYAVLDISDRMYKFPDNEIRKLGSVAWDAEGRRLFVAEHLGDEDDRPIVHVWSVG